MKYIMPQATHSFSIKLTSTNYLVWKTQFNPILKCYNLIGHINVSNPKPPEIVLNTITKDEEHNPAFTIWVQNDQMLLS